MRISDGHREPNGGRALLWRIGPAVCLAGACAGAAIMDVPTDEGAVTCPFRLATGGWCPGCGCTRAFRFLVHGDASTSLTLNPFLVVALVQVIVGAAAFLAAPAKSLTWLRRYDLRVIQANIAIALIIWVARLGTGAIPAPFGL